MGVGNTGEHSNSICGVLELVSLHKLAPQGDHVRPLAGPVILLERTAPNLAGEDAIGQSLKHLSGQGSAGLDVFSSQPGAVKVDRFKTIAAAEGIRPLALPDSVHRFGGAEQVLGLHQGVGQ